MRFFTCLFVCLGTAFAQSSSISGDGRRPVEKPGIALVKPQKWSAPNQAQIVRFTAYTNRGGYFVLRLPSGTERQVWVDQIVGEAPILRPDPPAELTDATQREALEKQIAEITALGRAVPSARDALAEIVKPLQDMLAEFDSGRVFVNGKWESADTHRVSQFDELESQLRRSLDAETTKAKFNLLENSSYKKIQQLAQGSPELQTRLNALRADYDRLVSLERQGEFIRQLSNPDITDTAKLEVLTRLRVFSDPGPETRSVLDQAATADLLRKEITAVKNTLEAFFAKDAVGPTVPTLPADLATRIATLSEEAKKFNASSPPAGIRIANDTVRSAVSIASDLPTVATEFANKQFSEATASIDRLEKDAGAIGPAARGYFIALKSLAATELAKIQPTPTPTPKP